MKSNFTIFREFQVTKIYIYIYPFSGFWFWAKLQTGCGHSLLSSPKVSFFCSFFLEFLKVDDVLILLLDLEQMCSSICKWIDPGMACCGLLDRYVCSSWRSFHGVRGLFWGDLKMRTSVNLRKKVISLYFAVVRLIVKWMLFDVLVAFATSDS